MHWVMLHLHYFGLVHRVKYEGLLSEPKSPRALAMYTKSGYQSHDQGSARWQNKNP